MPDAADAHPTRSIPADLAVPLDHRPTADPDPLATAGFTRHDGGEPPVAVPGYEFLEVLGRGGMGVVYKARQTALHRAVAVKMVRAGDPPDPRAVIRFLAEAEAVAAIHHPNVVQVYEFGQCQGRPYFVMEYLPGGTLAERLRDTPNGMPPEDAAALVRHLADAVQAAHDLQIIHRDLKPGNILFSSAERGSRNSEPKSGDAPPSSSSNSALRDPRSALVPKVTDFGLAKRGGAEAGGADLTRTQAVMGTPAYMAPEQAEGKGKFVGPAADIYALGVILYECITGTVPFVDDHMMAVLHRVVHDDPEPPRKRRADVPRDLELICLKCLAKNPAERYATAAALAADLERFGRGEPVSVRAAGALERSYKWARRNPSRAAAVTFGGVAAVFGAIGIALWLAWTRADEEGHRADAARRVAEAANAELTDAKGALEKALAGEKTARGQLDAALKTVSDERDRVKDLAGQQAALNDRLQETQRELVRQEYFRSVDLAHRGLLDGNARRSADLLEQCPPEFRGWEWHHAHRKLNSALLKFPGERNSFGYLEVSPAGPFFAITGGETRVYDLRTGAPVVTSAAGTFLSGFRFTTDGRLILPSQSQSEVWEVAAGLRTRLPAWPSGMTWDRDLSPDGRYATATSQPWDALFVIEMATGKPALTVKADKDGAALSLHTAFSPDGSRVAVGPIAGAVEVWDVPAGKRVAAVPLGKDPGEVVSVSALRFRPGGKDLLILASDDRLRAWDTTAGLERLNVTLRDRASGVAYTPDGRHIVAWGKGGVSLRTAETGQQLWTLPPADPVDGVAASRDGKRLAVWGGTAVHVLDAATGKGLQELHGHEGTVQQAAFAADGRLITLGEDRTAHVWDHHSAETYLPLDAVGFSDSNALFGGERRMAVNAAGTRLAVAGTLPHEVTRAKGERSIEYREAVRIWDLDRRTAVATFTGASRPIWIAFTPDDRHMLMATATGRVSQWDPQTGKQVPTRYWVTSGQLTAAFPARHLLATADDRSERVRIWDVSRVPERLVTSGRRYSPEDAKKELPPEQWPVLRGEFAVAGRVGALMFGPDGTHLAAVPIGRPGVVWDVEAGKGHELVAVQAGPAVLFLLTLPPMALAPGGGRLVWPLRRELKVTDARSGVEAITLGRRGTTIATPVFSADGRKLYALTDGGVMVFESASRPPFVPHTFEPAPPPREHKRD